MTGPVLQLRGIRVEYEDLDRTRPVLDGLDLDVAAGEVVAILGPNGSGKTTLLRVVAGTLRPAGGSVRLFGQPVEAMRRLEVARRVAVLPQALELPAGFTVAEAVAMGRIPHAVRAMGPTARDAAAVERALADAGVEELGARRVDRISGGEHQRVLVAMALAQEPDLLLLDEPTLHLDLARQVSLLRTLARIRATRSLTILAVLHDLNIAAAWADRCLFLQRGRLTPAGDAGRIDAQRAAAAFGIRVEEARTAGGRLVLVPAMPDLPPDREPRTSHAAD